jgi:hypothetical protein
LEFVTLYIRFHVKVKGQKLSLCLSKHYAIKTSREAKIFVV